ncbi:hypothetical protein [Microbulbifer sp. SAOS-129_SWC]|uniref:hypothetical protein n=1 Tax=Microbulbifer sp. SAOS-129_SWC TaxID=3145235 RepID=UPI0032163324
MPATTAQPRAPASASGLVARGGGLDQVAVATGLNLNGAAVYVAPIAISYRSPAAAGTQPLGFRNRTLDADALARLNDTVAQAFAERFLAPRGARLVSSADAADYTLHLRLDDFFLPAPLQQTTRLREVFSEHTAYGTLSGSLSDSRGRVALQFRDRREFGESFANLSSDRLKLFSPPAFWADMRTDLRRAFSSLDRSLRY